MTRLLLLLLLAAPDPFTGVWTLNAGQSKLPHPAPRSQTITHEAGPRGIRIREVVVDNRGDRVEVTVDARFDGKDYAITGTPFADAVACRRTGPRTIESAVKKAGKVVLLEKMTVSRDGARLTTAYSNPDGTPAGVAIFEKQQR